MYSFLLPTGRYNSTGVASNRAAAQQMGSLAFQKTQVIALTEVQVLNVFDFFSRNEPGQRSVSLSAVDCNALEETACKVTPQFLSFLLCFLCFSSPFRATSFAHTIPLRTEIHLHRVNCTTT